ncbi:HU family DNA-binding protein [Nocardioides sp.]|uniref:HU family DNA-binding protein n=1 Tax=Nocardioides sp. TaxID=35761 RepID=UPI002BDD9D9D|nr:HU family DNA-binding protein [Nocardioides sp.]HSX68872.1 HU family DNA-binding protein [Nocardioides sp.]
MNRVELIETVAREAGLSQKEAGAAVQSTLEAIVAAVAAGERVQLPGFGTFESRERSARTGRNPRTGEELAIAASVAPAFKPASAFKERVAR